MSIGSPLLRNDLKAAPALSLRVAAPLRGWCPEEEWPVRHGVVSKASRLRIAGKMPATPVAAFSTMLDDDARFLRSVAKQSPTPGVEIAASLRCS